MKKILLTCLAFIGAATPAFTQNADDTVLPIADIQTSDQEPFQQLIGYAIEVSSTALETKKPVGRYHCQNIYSMDGYNALFEHPCELIVHSESGPIVVRYKDVTSETDKQIKDFLSDNQMGDSLYYNNGRFRFSVDEDVAEE